MKRFTQYVYEYRDGKKIRNVGFVKGEFEETSGKLMMQARGVEGKFGAEIQVFLFYPKGEAYESVLQGTLRKRSPVLNDTLIFNKEDIGRAGTTEELTGLLLTGENGTTYMAVWNERNVDINVIREMQTEEVRRLEEQLLEEKTSCICEKIQRKDLAKLPRKHWYLANNNFLLHGFYTYHYLLRIEEGDELYIGVPGVCHAREAEAAKAFGFTEFRTVSELAMSSIDEDEERADFGYFCRRIGKANE